MTAQPTTTSRGIHVRTRDYEGELERLVDLIRAGEIPLERIDVAGVTGQLVEQLEVLGVEEIGTAAVLGAWLVELRAGAFYQEAALLLASMRPSEVLELPGGDGLIYIYDGTGDEAEDPREMLREIRIERERALVKALVASLEPQEVPRSFDRPDQVEVLGDGDAAGEGASKDKLDDGGESLSDVARMLRAASRVLPDVEWDTVGELRQEILEAVRQGPLRLSGVATRDRRVAAFLALLELVREPVLELAGGGGVLFVGVKAVQLEDDIVIGNPWDELPSPAAMRPPRLRSRVRPALQAVAPVRREDRLAGLVAAAHEKLDAMDRAAGIAITKVQTRAEISAAMEHQRVAR